MRAEQPIEIILIPALVSAVTTIAVVFVNYKLQKKNQRTLESYKLSIVKEQDKINEISEAKREISALLQKIKYIITSIAADFYTDTELSFSETQIKDISDQLHYIYGKHKESLGAVQSKIIHDGLHLVTRLRSYIHDKISRKVIDASDFKERLLKIRQELDVFQNQLFY